MENKTCPECGSPVAENQRFCTKCGKLLSPSTIALTLDTEASGPSGEKENEAFAAEPALKPTDLFQTGASFSEERKPTETEATQAGTSSLNPQQAKEEGKPCQTTAEEEKDLDPCPPRKSRYAPISTGGYLGIMLLMLVPVLNIVLLVLWASGSCRKVNKRNWARATLILLLVAVIAIFFFSTGLGKSLWESAMRQLVQWLPWLEPLLP